MSERVSERCLFVCLFVYLFACNSWAGYRGDWKGVCVCVYTSHANMDGWNEQSMDGIKWAEYLYKVERPFLWMVVGPNVW